MNLPDISLYKNKIEFFNQTVSQIKKDFESVGVEIKFAEDKNNDFTQLLNQLEPIVSELMQNNSQKYNAVINRIDLNETQITNAIEKNNLQSISYAITELIIKRELQKIVIRYHFRNE